MLVTVIINSMGSAVGPKINVIAMPSGIIPTGPDDASCVDPGYFSVSRVYDVPNDTTSIIIRSVEYNCSTPGVCNDYKMDILLAPTTTSTTTTPVAPSTTTTTTTSEVVPTTSTTTSTSSTTTTTTTSGPIPPTSTSTTTSSTSSTTSTTTTGTSSSTTTTTSTTSEPTTTTTSTTVLLGNCYDIVVPEAYFTQGGYTLWISYYPYGGGDVVYQAYTAYDDEGDMSPDVHIKLCALSTPNEPLFWYNDIAYDHDDWIIAQCDNMCDEHTDCVNCTTTTTTTGEPTTTTTTTEPPLCYHIEIPDDKLTYLGADLYINRQLPGGSSEEIVYFNIPETEERVDYYVINICSIFEPLFSYGPPYNHVSIPEIEITINGTCDEDTDCVSPTTTSTSSTTTTSTTICPLYEVYLQIADTANDACVAPSVQYWMDTVVFGIGSEIYSDCGTTLITNTYAVKVDTQRIYTVSAGVIATDTGDDCV